MAQKGRIYKKDASWWFRYKSPVILDGQKYWKDRYVKLAPADQFASALAVEKSGLIDSYKTELDTSKMTPSTMQLVNDFIEHVYFPHRKAAGDLRPSTMVGYKNLHAHHLKPRFEGLRMCDFTVKNAQQILNRIAQERPDLSSQTMKHLKWFSVSVFKLAATEGAFNPNAKNPFFEVDIPKTQHKTLPTRYASLDTIVSMINVLDEPGATVVAVAAFTGLRKSEIQGLRWEDLDGNQLHVRRAAWRTTTIDETKTDASEAPVPIIPVLADYLEAHRNGFPADGFIFSGPKFKKRPLDLHNLAERVIRPALEENNIPWCGWHGFRRGLATTLYELGTDAKTRQEILRHADPAITEKHYTKPVSAVSQKAMRKVQNAFKAKLRKSRKKPRI
jgi:integrase